MPNLKRTEDRENHPIDFIWSSNKMNLFFHNISTIFVLFTLQAKIIKWRCCSTSISNFLNNFWE